MAESAATKTERPTARRLREARRKGQQGIGRDLMSAASFCFTAATVWVAIPTLCTMASSSFLRSCDLIDRGAEPTIDWCWSFLLDSMKTILWSAMVLSLPGIGATLLVGLLQTKGAISFDPVSPKFERISPATGFKRLFTLRTVLELTKLLGKSAILVTIFIVGFRNYASPIAGSVGRSPLTSVYVLGELATSIFLYATAAIVAVAVADLLVQKRLHLRELRMSRSEVRRDIKEDEGDPIIKHARRRMHREISQYRTIRSVSGSNVIVVNPTHVAVALRFDPEKDVAPRVVAKGVGNLAYAIRREGRRSGVQIVTNPRVARSLLRVPLNGEIPEALYLIVAEILAHITEIEASRSQSEQRAT